VDIDRTEQPGELINMGGRTISVLAFLGLVTVLGTGVFPAAAEGTPAAAASRLDACGPHGACGSATFTFQDRRNINPISMSVKDSKCDHDAVYIRFVVDNGSEWRTKKRTNSSGCDGSYVTWNNGHINDNLGIRRVRIETCVDSPGADECNRSPWQYNPYY
jgi:hypothetical protein